MIAESISRLKRVSPAERNDPNHIRRTRAKLLSQLVDDLLMLATLKDLMLQVTFTFTDVDGSPDSYNTVTVDVIEVPL